MFLRMLIASLVLAAPAVAADTTSPYVGQESREIKSLSAQEIDDYLAGKGMGLAKAAELNGYPGPAHVLELSEELDLSAEQRTKTEALFAKMERSAIALGTKLVQEERVLDRLFASRTVDEASLSETLTRIGALQARLRQAHLAAHLEQTALLSPGQVARYFALRGYGAGAAEERPGNGHHGHHGH